MADIFFAMSECMRIDRFSFRTQDEMRTVTERGAVAPK